MLRGNNYTITKENLLIHELIGLNVRIIKSTDRSRLCEGRIIDETKNTFTIECVDKIRKIPKREVNIEFDLGGEKICVDGKILAVRPQERTKLLRGKIKW
ncbi:MAG: ribonuclease P protein subunit [Candidatus Diapherotrites archaeon]|nr:ribonuclease P protein subunit [Candidatus Diapherotrites archaeon]